MMKNLQLERLVISIGALVYAEKILEVTLDYTRSREVFGKPIAGFQYNSFKIVEMATEIELARTFIESLAEEYMNGEDINRRVAMAKWWIAEMTNRIAYQCVQLHGGYGYMEEYLVCRLYRDVRAMTIGGGGYGSYEAYSGPGHGASKLGLSVKRREWIDLDQTLNRANMQLRAEA